MYNTIKNKSFLLVLLGVFLFASSCAPVHRFTRVKKIPREHSLNYCGGDIKAPKTDLNKEPWVVYSDREQNQTFNNAGGKVKAKDVDYLDPFLVIGKKKKGEYLRLIKHTPDILKNGKLDHKKAEYYGWIHKSKLLLEQQSITDISSGKKNKTLAIFADSISINEPEKFFDSDAFKLYKDLELKSQTGELSPFSIIYQLKNSEDGARTLIAKKPYIQPETAKEDILGWVDNSLIKDIGTGLHINLQTIPQDDLHFFIAGSKDVAITEDIGDASKMLSEQYKTIKYNPVSSYSTKDFWVAFRTRMVLPVFDYSLNYIFNVNGEPISHKQFRTVTKNLRNINISFVFEGGEQTIEQFPQVVNSLQNLQPLFENSDDSYTYRFNCVMTFDETGNLSVPLSTGFMTDYSQLINFLSDKANMKDKLRPMRTVNHSWSALHKSVDSFSNHKDATNLIVLIGDKRADSSGFDTTLVNRMLAHNCRVIGFQTYAGDGDDYNNFVLDIEDMISSYADKMLKTKRDILVKPEQIKRDNSYTQVGEQTNGYRLDFPDNSITQGALFFPQKLETLPMEILSNSIDTIIGEIKHDNNSVIQYMSKAFRSTGNNRTMFDNLFVRNYGIDGTRIPQKKLIGGFSDEAPGWYMPSRIVLLNNSTNNTLDYRLMLSEAEMKELKEFIAALSEKEVDFIQGEEVNKSQKKRKPCDCPEDDLFLELEKEAGAEAGMFVIDAITGEVIFQPDSIAPIEYINTKKIRKHLKKTLLDPIKYCKLCKEKKKSLKRLTLAEAQYRITGIPTFNETLNSIRVKELKKKKVVTDEVLDELISYYKEMKKELDKAEQFESNGETYYWVEQKLLP